MSTSDQHLPSSPWHPNSPTAEQRERAREQFGTFTPGPSNFEVWLAGRRPEPESCKRNRGTGLYAAYLSSMGTFERAFKRVEAERETTAAIVKAQGGPRLPAKTTRHTNAKNDDGCPF